MSELDPITKSMSVIPGEERYTPHSRAAVRKALFRLLPFLMLMYVVSFIDRTNIGFAEKAFETHAGISTAAYALGAGLFFIGYAIFEVPSNLILHKVGARIWIARIMVTWGIVAAAFMFVQGPISFLVLRFLLGVAEAGFFPGIILYLTYWFPRRKRGNATALFFMGIPIAQILGGPLSGALLDLDGLGGLMGTQWMFLVEGLLAIVVGVVAFFFLDDRPVDAKWLSRQEQYELQTILDAEADEKVEAHPLSWWQALINGRILFFCLLSFMIQLSMYGLTFFLPQQVAEISGRKVGLVVGLLVAIPWSCGLLANIFAGRFADRTSRYRSTAAVLLIGSGIGLFMTAAFSGPILAMVGLCLAAIGFCSAQPLFWNLPTSYLSGAALASAVGMINGLGNLGGFFAPSLRVWVESALGSDTAGLFMLSVCPVIAAGMILATKAFEKKDVELFHEQQDPAPRG